MPVRWVAYALAAGIAGAGGWREREIGGVAATSPPPAPRLQPLQLVHTQSNVLACLNLDTRYYRTPYFFLPILNRIDACQRPKGSSRK